jgi:hypothetical protein
VWVEGGEDFVELGEMSRDEQFRRGKDFGGATGICRSHRPRLKHAQSAVAYVRNASTCQDSVINASLPDTMT